jgi:hypothetical protein
LLEAWGEAKVRETYPEKRRAKKGWQKSDALAYMTHTTAQRSTLTQ